MMPDETDAVDEVDLPADAEPGQPLRSIANLAERKAAVAALRRWARTARPAGMTDLEFRGLLGLVADALFATIKPLPPVTMGMDPGAYLKTVTALKALVDAYGKVGSPPKATRRKR